MVRVSACLRVCVCVAREYRTANMSLSLLQPRSDYLFYMYVLGRGGTEKLRNTKKTVRDRSNGTKSHTCFLVFLYSIKLTLMGLSHAAQGKPVVADTLRALPSTGSHGSARKVGMQSRREPLWVGMQSRREPLWVCREVRRHQCHLSRPR